ncbi:MAG: transposase, partial [Caldilineaceae bacterium]|nr:transposase [Caldilineaceae bacterium]
MNAWMLPVEMLAWIECLSGPLHGRLAWRLPLLFAGALFAQGRRTVASWLRAGGLGVDFRRYYYFLGSLGRKTREVASRLFGLVISRVSPGPRILLALDDSPTKRYGPMVEGAAIHHNPTPGPADQKYLYGHVWVVLALVVHHPLWGTIALPLFAKLYVRACTVLKLPSWYGWQFKTKLEQGAELVEWAANCAKRYGKTVWVVADGAYAKLPFIARALAAGVVVVSRLRHDAALYTLPPTLAAGKKRGRGRPPKYGKDRISLSKRAAHRQGWIKAQFQLYGETVTKTYKTFLATYQPAEGVIRVVLVKERKSWVAFFCTDPAASVAQILEAVADRASLEQVFHDVKEVHGAGQQQLRNYWANMAAFNLNLWLQTLIELWAWNQPHEALADRSASPWDDPTRRPSHADRRQRLR